MGLAGNFAFGLMLCAEMVPGDTDAVDAAEIDGVVGMTFGRPFFLVPDTELSSSSSLSSSTELSTNFWFKIFCIFKASWKFRNKQWNKLTNSFLCASRLSLSFIPCALCALVERPSLHCPTLNRDRPLNRWYSHIRPSSIYCVSVPSISVS